MITYRDKAFCVRKDCPVTKCDHNLCHVPRQGLPEGMGIALADFYGAYSRYCPKKPLKLPDWAKEGRWGHGTTD